MENTQKSNELWFTREGKRGEVEMISIQLILMYKILKTFNYKELSSTELLSIKSFTEAKQNENKVRQTGWPDAKINTKTENYNRYLHGNHIANF